MIDNFDLLEPFLQFDHPGDCYFIQLLKRQKDNPTMKRNMVNVDNFFVYSLADYRKMKEHIVESATLHNARAYIRVNRRNTYQLTLHANRIIAELLISKDYKAVKNAYLSAAGKFHSEQNKKWILDWDGPMGWEQKQMLTARLEMLQPIGNKIIMEIPTKNGMHFICKPFRLDHFKQFDEYKLIDIHKDNPTVLYHP
jgi:hypothetical protein